MGVSEKGEMYQKPVDNITMATAPRVCVIDAKQHIRTFLNEALEGLGFLTRECAGANELGEALNTHVSDLLVIGLSAGGLAVREMLEVIARKGFDGRVLLLASRLSPQIAAVHSYGQQLGLAMLPILATPFGTDFWRDKVAEPLPAEVPSPGPIDVKEALSAGWLELWYQPKFDVRTLNFRGAEALIRMRHPTWGIVPPAYFIPDDGDPHCRALSEFVIERVAHDWAYFFDQSGHVDLAINLPLAFLQELDAVKVLCDLLPKHPAFEGLIIEINGTEAIRDLDMIKDRAKELRFHNVAISIDDLGSEWPLLIEMHDFPFVEIKVDKKFVDGCASNRLKQSICHRILDLAQGLGSRTVAEGVESRVDFFAVREMGFNIVQGYLLGRPMVAKKFVQTTQNRRSVLSQRLEPGGSSCR